MTIRTLPSIKIGHGTGDYYTPPSGQYRWLSRAGSKTAHHYKAKHTSSLHANVSEYDDGRVTWELVHVPWPHENKPRRVLASGTAQDVPSAMLAAEAALLRRIK